MSKDKKKVNQIRFRSRISEKNEKFVHISAVNNKTIIAATKDGRVVRHGIYKKHGENKNIWRQIGDINNVVRVATEQNGNPWAVNASGKVFMFDSKKWQ